MNDSTQPDNNTQPDNPIPQAQRVIYKYEFKFSNTVTELQMPEGAEILYLHGSFIWALVDASKQTEVRKIVSIRTGEAISDPSIPQYLIRIGSVFKPSVGDGSGCVYHVFDGRATPPALPLTVELKRWLLHKVQRELVSARSNASISAAVSVLGGSSMNTNEVDMLEALESQLKH